MDYEKLYKEALERARQVHTTNVDENKKSTEYIFPELKESEDERVRKSLIDMLKNDEKCYLKEIAWLEKQGDKYSVNFDEAEKEKYDFVSGQYIECRASFNEFKENNSYWLEYIGNDTYIGRSDNVLNQKFHITPRQLYSLFTQQHCPKEDNTNEEANAPTEYGKYVDDCLNEASKHFFSEGEDKYSVADLFYAGVRCGKSWLEKQGEKPQGKSALEAVKEEPKPMHTFKPFDKVLVCNAGETKWLATEFSCYNPNDAEHYYRAINNGTYSHCIPYEGNEHLNGVKFKIEHISW